MGRPKALLPLGGKTFLERILDTAQEAGLDPLRVVVSEHGGAITAALPALAPLLLRNERPELGQLHSLRLAVDSLPEQVRGAVVFLVDHPLVRVETVTALLAAASATLKPVAVPVHRGRRGHPVYLGRETFLALFEAPLERGARAVLEDHPERVAEVAVADPGVLVDVDTPAEYEEVRRDGKA
jgi:molybdenum cofactor cytidylyltransferase